MLRRIVFALFCVSALQAQINARQLRAIHRSAYETNMPKLGLALLCILAALLSGCGCTCDSLDQTTHITLGLTGFDKPTIDDPAQIRSIVAFVNQRRRVEPDLATPFEVPITATFYHGSKRIGSFGSGKNTFYVDGADCKGIRSATAEEIAQFQRLIGFAPKS